MEMTGMELTMNVTKADGKYLVKLSGYLDTNSAPDFQTRVEELSIEALDAGGLNLDIDMEEVAFVSSAGLRVLLLATKIAKRQKGSVVVRNVKDSIKEVLDMTGFSSILDVR
jgi:anti-anti-sigma factor